MASPFVTQALAKLKDPSAEQKDRSSSYNELLKEIALKSESSQVIPDLTAYIDSILDEGLGIVAARPLLSAYVEAVKSIPGAVARIEIGTHALERLQARVVSFEEQDVMIREILADAYQEQEEYNEAARILQGIQLESSQRKISDDYKVRTWIRICRLYLEEDDTTSAESYLNRAKNSLYKVGDKELNLMFQLSQARILDARRRFLDASQVYHSFSFSPVLDEEEKTRALSSAIICAVLAPAGPQRSRALAKLYKDERAPNVEEYGILEKIFLDRLLSPTEVARFADKLSPHQLAQTADGSTVLAKAVIEHNLLGASRIYDNTRMEDLGILLGLDAEKAEEYAAGMLEQGRLSGKIDQIDGIIYFGSGSQGPGRGIRKWDSNVQGLLEEVERVASMLQAEYPVCPRIH